MSKYYRFEDMAIGRQFLFGNSLYQKCSKTMALCCTPVALKVTKRRFLKDDKCEKIKRLLVVGQDGTKTDMKW